MGLITAHSAEAAVLSNVPEAAQAFDVFHERWSTWPGKPSGYAQFALFGQEFLVPQLKNIPQDRELVARCLDIIETLLRDGDDLVRDATCFGIVEELAPVINLIDAELLGPLTARELANARGAAQ